jgi:hypothetical protein
VGASIEAWACDGAQFSDAWIGAMRDTIAAARAARRHGNA